VNVHLGTMDTLMLNAGADALIFMVHIAGRTAVVDRGTGRQHEMSAKQMSIDASRT